LTDDLTVCRDHSIGLEIVLYFSSIRALVCGGKPAVYGLSMDSWMTGDVVHPFVSLAAGIAAIDSE